MKHTLTTLCLGLALVLAPPASAALSHRPTATGVDVTARYMTRDFSPLLIPRTPILGFAGANYQRLHVVFLSISPDPTVAGQYIVTGFTLYKGRQTPFTGTLTTQKIDRLKAWHTGTDDEMKGRVRDEGALFATYSFREADGAKLIGTMELDWYVDTHGRLVYDDIDGASDGYCNNQYTGTWTLPSGTVTANFGEYRIPQSGDLDNGAAEFHAAAKYAAYGWPPEPTN